MLFLNPLKLYVSSIHKYFIYKYINTMHLHGIIYHIYKYINTLHHALLCNKINSAAQLCNYELRADYLTRWNWGGVKIFWTRSKTAHYSVSEWVSHQLELSRRKKVFVFFKSTIIRNVKEFHEVIQRISGSHSYTEIAEPCIRARQPERSSDMHNAVENTAVITK